jgi:hypothetical protein
MVSERRDMEEPIFGFQGKKLDSSFLTSLRSSRLDALPPGVESRDQYTTKGVSAGASTCFD